MIGNGKSQSFYQIQKHLVLGLCRLFGIGTKRPTWIFVLFRSKGTLVAEDAGLTKGLIVAPGL